MENIEVIEATTSAQNGDDLVRERLITHYKPYVLNTVGHICKKFVSWSEEEASIGLIALNKAIDTFDASKGRTFLNYVYLLIKRDLIDFFRKEKNEKHLSMNEYYEDHVESPFEVEKSLQQFEKEKQTNDLIEEILELSIALSQYQINFEDLEKYSPKHRDTRENLVEMADRFVTDDDCVAQFLRKKQFPTTLFVKNTGYRAKTIERHRKYLVTLVLVKLNPQWTQLREFIQIGGGS